MPSVSKKQHNLMAAVANNPAFAKKAGIPQRVGADFLKADKGRKFAKGGDMAKKMPPFMGKESKAEEAKEMKIKAKSPAKYLKGEKAEGVHGKSGMEKPTKYAKGGFTRAADGVATKGKTKGQRFAMGGMPVGMAGPQGMTPAQRPLKPNISPAPVAPASTTATSPGPKISHYVKGYGAPGYGGPPPKAKPILGVAPAPSNYYGSAGPAPKPPTPAKPESSSPRPTNPFTNPKQYQAEYQAEMAKQKEKPFAKPQGGKVPSFDGTPLDMRYRDNDVEPRRKGFLRGVAERAASRAMPQQRGGLSNISSEAKSNIGNALAKMMGGVRAKGAKEMASRGATGFNAPNMMDDNTYGAKKVGSVTKFAGGGSIDGCATTGKAEVKGRVC